MRRFRNFVEREKTFPIIIALIFISSILFYTGCAGGPSSRRSPSPEWLLEEWIHTETEYRFRGIAEAQDALLAQEGATQMLVDGILQAMDLGSPDDWDSAGREALTALFDQIIQGVGNTQMVDLPEGFAILRRGAWSDGAKHSGYAVDAAWESEAFEEYVNELAMLAGVASAQFRGLELRAMAAEKDGNGYEAALIWASAAHAAEVDGTASSYRRALRQVVNVLESVEVGVETSPPTSYVDLRPDSPLVARAFINGKPISNAEFLVTYPRSARDGSPARGYARVFSDEDGRIQFLPPPVPFVGQQVLTIAPSAAPFLEPLDDKDETSAINMAEIVEEPRVSARYETQPHLKELRTGIVVLETDLAGNPLASGEAAGGLFDDLKAQNFLVEVMELDPRELLSRNSRELLRDLKADERFYDNYDRVVHGTVTLESFEQVGDSYTVRVSGTLSYSDIPRQSVRFRSTITKSSQASDGQQAINAAFRQLGRSFAAELAQRAAP